MTIWNANIAALKTSVASDASDMVNYKSVLTLAVASIALMGTLAAGVVSPLHLLIGGGAFVIGIAISHGRGKFLSANNDALKTKISDLTMSAQLLGCEIVECDQRSKIIKSINSKLMDGQVLSERINVADRPSFLLALSYATDACQTLNLRMKTGANHHFTDTEIKLQNFSGRLFAALTPIDPILARQSAKDVSCELAHELRTPLSAIVGLADAMCEHKTCTDDMRATYPALIANAGRSLIALTGSILEDKTNSAVQPQAKLGTVTQECLALLQPMAKQQSITLFNRVADTLCDKLVDGNAVRQILTNLIANAVKFSPAGSSVEVNASISANGWTLSVADNGNGIAPEDVARLGQKKFRSEKTAGVAGFGLGLSIVGKLVDQLGARISFESRPGHGTRVEIAFPASRLVELADFQSQAAVAAVAYPNFKNAAGAKYAAA
jgi:signal transduction histidine kinase